MRRLQPEWSVSVPAQLAGAAALQDEEYIERTRTFLKQEKEKMYDALRRAGIRFFASDVGFILIKTAPGLYERMLEQGFLIRKCENFKGLTEEFYRISIRSGKENELFRKRLVQMAG